MSCYKFKLLFNCYIDSSVSVFPPALKQRNVLNAFEILETPAFDT